MREYKMNICVSDSNRLTEKAFKQSITISIIGILLCMVALCSVTWAWFSTEISSLPSDIRSAYCDVTVSVANENNILDPVDGKYNFVKNKAYQIQITATGNAETAYCILRVGGADYYTEQIPTQTGIVFTLQFEDDTPVEIITCWGTSSVPNELRSFANNGLYLNCEVVETLPVIIPEATKTDETTTTQPNSTESTATETTNLETTSDSPSEETTAAETLATEPTDTEETPVTETTIDTPSSTASSEVSE